MPCCSDPRRHQHVRLPASFFLELLWCNPPILEPQVDVLLADAVDASEQLADLERLEVGAVRLDRVKAEEISA